MSAAPSDDLAGLLRRHAPVLRYDSRERFFATSVDAWDIEALTMGESGAAERVYGHAARDGGGRWWLAYWFFYTFNDYTLLGPWLHVGAHEGDWEMIQLRLDRAGDAPDRALYAQHSHVAVRRWSEVERVAERPVVYVARDCHACHFRPGLHWTGVWFDHADGAGRSPELELELLDEHDPAHAWLRWPGRWGATRSRPGLAKRLGLDASSPHGPAHQRQWRDPTGLFKDVWPRDRMLLES